MQLGREQPSDVRDWLAAHRYDPTITSYSDDDDTDGDDDGANGVAAAGPAAELAAALAGLRVAGPSSAAAAAAAGNGGVGASAAPAQALLPEVPRGEDTPMCTKNGIHAEAGLAWQGSRHQSRLANINWPSRSNFNKQL